MNDSSSSRSDIVAFLAILAISALTMLWLFWRFPLTTGLVTIGVLAGLGLSARLARSIEVDTSDLPSPRQPL